MSSSVVAGKAAPRGKYPHVKRAGDFVFVSGTSARQADNSIPGAEIDAAGTAKFDIRAQTRGVLDNIRDSLRQYPRPLYVIYMAPGRKEALLDTTDFLVKQGRNAQFQFCWYKAR